MQEGNKQHETYIFQDIFWKLLNISARKMCHLEHTNHDIPKHFVVNLYKILICSCDLHLLYLLCLSDRKNILLLVIMLHWIFLNQQQKQFNDIMVRKSEWTSKILFSVFIKIFGNSNSIHKHLHSVKASVHYLSPLLKEQCLSWLFQTKHFERKFNFL